MTNWTRYITGVVVRRVVTIVVLALIAWLGVGRASAQTPDYSGCFNTSLATALCPDITQALAGARARMAAVNGTLECGVDYIDGSGSPTTPELGFQVRIRFERQGRAGRCPAGSDSAQRRYNNGCPVGEEWDPVLLECKEPDPCELGEDGGATVPVVEGGIQCRKSGKSGEMCQFLAAPSTSGMTKGYVAWFGVGGSKCTPEEDCLPGYYKDPMYGGVCMPFQYCPDGSMKPLGGECPEKPDCPAGQEKGPDGICRDKQDDCPAGKVKAPDGSCIDRPCPAGYVKSAQGTCVKDDDDDGQPDDGPEDGNRASGGDHCNSPPVCSGDEIMCLHAKQLWRVDCNTRRTKSVVLDNYCQRPPICENTLDAPCDAVQEASLYLQWKNVCETQRVVDAINALGKGTAIGGGNGEGLGKCPDGIPRTTEDRNCNGQPDWTENPGDGTNADLGDPGAAAGMGIIVDGPEIGGSGLDTSGYGWVRSCPVVPSVSVMGTVIEFDTSAFCDWMLLGGQLVLIGAALLSLRLIGEGV